MRIKSFTLPVLGATLASLAIVAAPLAPAFAATNAWGSWSSEPDQLHFTGTSAVDATWTVTGAASSEILDTTTEGEYFIAGTPIGAAFGANGPSLGANFLKVSASATAITTVTFASAVPAGELGFAVSDLDTDHVTVTATDSANNPLTGAQIIGTASHVAFNFCIDTPFPPCSDTAVPTMTTNANDVVAQGSLASSDGSTAWFRPSVAVKSVTFTYVNDDAPSSPSTSRYWFAEKQVAVDSKAASLPNTGMNSSLMTGLLASGMALLAAGVLLIVRGGRKA